MQKPGKRGPKRWAAVGFVALAPKLAEALKKGHKIVALYEEHGAALGISYSQFARYVAQHITGKSPKAPQGSPIVDKAHHAGVEAIDRRQAAASKRTNPISTPAVVRQFEFDPTRANRPGRDKELF